MLLIDVGLTLLGGPKMSPAAFLAELLAQPPSWKEKAADLLFCRHHQGPQNLISELETLLHHPVSSQESQAISDYWHNQVQACVPLPGAEDFCLEVVRRGYDFCLVSNLWRPFHLALTKYLPFMETKAKGLFLSYQMGARKPSPAFYDQVYTRLALPPENLTIIGDSLKNDLIPALERGSHGILLASWRFDPSQDLAGEMATRYPLSRFGLASDHRQCLLLIEDFMENAK